MQLTVLHFLMMYVEEYETLSSQIKVFYCMRCFVTFVTAIFFYFYSRWNGRRIRVSTMRSFLFSCNCYLVIETITMHFLVIFKVGICRALFKMLTWKQQVADMGTTKILCKLTLYLQCGIRWQYKCAMEVSKTYEKTNAHDAYCPIKEYFHLYSVQA